MKKVLKYIIIFVIIIIALMIIILILNSTPKETTNIEKNPTIALEENSIKEEPKDEVIVIGLDPKEEIVQEAKEDPKPEPPKDAATLTQEVYNINGPIGTLYIPKTRTKNYNLQQCNSRQNGRNAMLSIYNRRTKQNWNYIICRAQQNEWNTIFK